MNDFLKGEVNLILNLENNLVIDEFDDFYSVLDKYLENRSKEETFLKNLVELRNLLYDFGLSEREVIDAIKLNPSYIHANKVELVVKFYLLGKVVDSENNNSVRNEIIVRKGKFLRTNYNVIYARIKHLMFLRENFEILRSETITARKIFKLTNEEFETSYGMSRDGLLNAYPFTTQTLDEIKNWPENKQILNDYEEKRNARSK